MSVVSKYHCKYCFDTLINKLTKDKQPIINEFENNQFPLFVTWNINKGGESHLRGCIGNFGEMDLVEGLKDYALISALQDTRFSPITLEEVPYLSCSVSLLINFQPAKNYLDWKVGKHGIRIEFKNEYGKIKTATYLPEVAKEQGWDQETTIMHLLHKGGYRSEVTDELLDSIKVVTYESEKYTLTYQEYMKLKQPILN